MRDSVRRFYARHLGLDHADHGEVLEVPLAGEAPVGGDPARVAADEGAADLDAAVVAVGGDGTLNAVAQAAQDVGALMVHYSTDYVFDGSGDTPWVETDSTGPLSVYGSTKLEGEQLVAQHCARHLILRTSWVYAARGGNFAKTMLRLGQEREKLTVINDQFGAPTGADLLADVTALALRQVTPSNTASDTLAGIYHLVAAGTTTWFDYAKHVLAQAEHAQHAIKIKTIQIDPVATSAFPTPARRPHNSRLNTGKLQRTFGLRLPPWQHGVNRMLAEIL